MISTAEEQEFLYNQGLANLKLEGMSLDAEQDRLARQYLAGEMSKQQLIQEALNYARSL